MKTGIVTKSVAGVFTVSSEGGNYAAFGRKKVKREADLLAGDAVLFTVTDDEKKTAVVEKILPRKNTLLRPPVANVDVQIIIISPEPKPDLTVVDKMLVNTLFSGVDVAIAVNKSDIAPAGFFRDIQENYENICPVFEVSANTGAGIIELKEFFRGKTVCLAGQSAAGKTSLVNALLEKNLKTGGIIKKTGVGRQTTRVVEIFEGDGFKIADSCGFSVFDLAEIDPFELASYFPDFDEFRGDCKYHGCTHTKEEGCAVREAAAAGKLKASRYNRYAAIFEEAKNNWKKRY